MNTATKGSLCNTHEAMMLPDNGIKQHHHHRQNNFLPLEISQTTLSCGHTVTLTLASPQIYYLEHAAQPFDNHMPSVCKTCALGSKRKRITFRSKLKTPNALKEVLSFDDGKTSLIQEHVHRNSICVGTEQPQQSGVCTKRDLATHAAASHSKNDWSGGGSSPEKVPTTFEELCTSLAHPPHLVREVTFREELIGPAVRVTIRLGDKPSKDPLATSLFVVNQIETLDAIKLVIAQKFRNQIKNHVMNSHVGYIDQIQIFVADHRNKKVPICKRGTITNDVTYGCFIMIISCFYDDFSRICCCGSCECSVHIPEIVVDIKSYVPGTSSQSGEQFSTATSNVPEPELEFEPNAFTKRYAKFHKGQQDHGNPKQRLPKVVLPISAMQDLLECKTQKEALQMEVEKQNRTVKQKDRNIERMQADLKSYQMKIMEQKREIDSLRKDNVYEKNPVEKHTYATIDSAATKHDEEFDDELWHRRRKSYSDAEEPPKKSQKIRHGK